jgi:hypothetical protein
VTKGHMAYGEAVTPFRLRVTASLIRRRPAADVIDLEQLKAATPLQITFRKMYFERLTTVCNTMAAGATEVARNAIVNMRLGLPREKK